MGLEGKGVHGTGMKPAVERHHQCRDWRRELGPDSYPQAGHQGPRVSPTGLRARLSHNLEMPAFALNRPPLLPSGLCLCSLPVPSLSPSRLFRWTAFFSAQIRVLTYRKCPLPGLPGLSLLLPSLYFLPIVLATWDFNCPSSTHQSSAIRMQVPRGQDPSPALGAGGISGPSSQPLEPKLFKSQLCHLIAVES